VIDDLLAQLFGEVVLGGLGRSRRAQLLCRVFFGLLGAALGITGAVWFTSGDRAAQIGDAAMRASMIAMFVFLAAFSLFNVALGRRWRWPGVAFAASFAAIIATRLVGGP
jgi:hypothetical protein